MWQAVDGHGRVLIANFKPDNHGRGYMEAFMDWFLICRDQEQIAALADDLVESHAMNVFEDRAANVVYLKIVRDRTSGEPLPWSSP